MSCNGSCIICSDNFVPTSTISATKCGHVFHQKCLFDWLDVRLTCPKCSSKAPKDSIVRKLFFDGPEEELSEENPDYLRNALHSLQVELREKDIRMKEVEVEMSNLRSRIVEHRRNLIILQSELEQATKETLRLNSQLSLVDGGVAANIQQRHVNDTKLRMVLEKRKEDVMMERLYQRSKDLQRFSKELDGLRISHMQITNELENETSKESTKERNRR